MQSYFEPKAPTPTPKIPALTEFNGNIQRELRAIERAFPFTDLNIYETSLFMFKPKSPPPTHEYRQHLSIIHNTTLSATDKMAAIGEILEQLLHSNHFHRELPSSRKEIPRYTYSVTFLNHLYKLVPPDQDTPPAAITEKRDPRRSQKTLANQPNPTRALVTTKNIPSRKPVTPNPMITSKHDATTHGEDSSTTSKSSTSSIPTPPLDLTTKFATEYSNHNAATHPSTPPDESIDEQIATYDRKFEIINTEIQSIADSLADDRDADSIEDSDSDSITDSFATTIDPSPIDQVQSLITTALQANDTKWTDTLSKITAQITIDAQKQLGTSEFHIRALETKLKTMDNDLSATNLLLNSQSEKLTTLDNDLSATTLLLDTQSEKLEATTLLLDTQSEKLEKQSKTLEKSLQQLNTATSTAWALDHRINKANTILKSLKSTTNTLKSYQDTSTIDPHRTIDSHLDRTSATLTRMSNGIEHTLAQLINNQLSQLDQTLNTRIQNQLDTIDKESIIQSIKDKLISHSTLEIKKCSLDHINDHKLVIKQSRHDTTRLITSHSTHLTNHLRKCLHELSNMGKDAVVDLDICKNTAISAIESSISNHLSSSPETTNHIATLIKTEMAQVITSTDFAKTFSQQLDTFLTDSESIAEYITTHIKEIIADYTKEIIVDYTKHIPTTATPQKHSPHQEQESPPSDTPPDTDTHPPKHPTPWSTDRDGPTYSYFEDKNREMEHDRLQKMNHHISKAINTMERTYIDTNNLPNDNRYLTSIEFSAIYQDLSHAMDLQSLPIVPLKQLQITQSCLPLDHMETPQNIGKIGTFIFKRLQQMIPQTHTRLRGLLSPYQLEMQGYQALYAMARTSLPYLRPNKTGWGPKWIPTDDPSTYVGKLQEFVRNSELSRQHMYSDIDQSYEMIHQAMQNHNFPAGCSMMAQLDHHQRDCTTNHRSVNPLPAQLQLTSMINFFLDYPISQQPTQIQPTIHKFDNKTRKFEYRNKIQCRCCHLYGHNIGDQVCRIGAQVHHSTNFSKAHPKEFNLNAEKHTQMNKKSVVKSVIKFFDGKTATEAEHETKREEYITTFFDNTSFTTIASDNINTDA